MTLAYATAATHDSIRTGRFTGFKNRRISSTCTTSIYTNPGSKIGKVDKHEQKVKDIRKGLNP